MSLFQQLSRLSSSDRFQTEDFHTEIVAQVLRNSPALTLAWLKDIGATTLQSADHVGIDTQERFAKLTTHKSGSRLDLTIRLVANGSIELIFIESKLPSKQGVDQLQRYAEQLEAAHRENPLARTSLVFITRDYEVAEEPTHSDPAFRLTFCPTRWFIFYRHLKAHLNGDGLAKELKLFMEENCMSLGNQFRSTHLVALENFTSAKALMDETLTGEVREAASNIIGEVTSAKKILNQLPENRYVLHHGNWRGDIDFLIGYWLPHESPDDPVWVGITILSNPASPFQKQVTEAFRAWLKGGGHEWETDGLDDERAWRSIYKGKEIQAFTGEPDHVRAVKNHLLDS